MTKYVRAGSGRLVYGIYLQQPEKKKSSWGGVLLFIVGVFIALALLGAAASDPADQGDAPRTPPAATRDA